MTSGAHEKGEPGEIFLKLGKSWTTSTSRPAGVCPNMRGE